MATRINHLSDFILYETFTRFDKQVAVPERLRITYFTETGFPRCFVAERNGSEFRNCALSPDGNTLQVYIALSRHYIGTGPVKKIITEILDSPVFPDGERRVNAPSDTSIILWSGTSDTSIETADESVLYDLLYGYSAYELAKKYGYEGTEEEYAMAPLLAINELPNYAKKDLSNVDTAAFRDKGILPVSSFVYSVDGDHAVTPANAGALAEILYGLSGSPDSLLYAESIASVGGDIGLSPVSFSLIAEDPIDYSLTFVGNDEYLHVLRVNGLGAITQQYAYRIDDLATKESIISSGYRPMRVIDLGIYQNGEFSLNGTPYWGDMQRTLYSYLDGGCGVLLRAHNQYEEPLVFVPARIYRDGGTRYVMEFMVSATQLCEIGIDEDADVEGGGSLFAQTFRNIGGGSGTITSEAYTDNKDYNEI